MARWDSAPLLSTAIYSHLSGSRRQERVASGIIFRYFAKPTGCHPWAWVTSLLVPLQNLPKFQPCAVQSAANRADGYLESLGDVLVLLAVDLFHDQDDLVLERELVECLLNPAFF